MLKIVLLKILVLKNKTYWDYFLKLQFLTQIFHFFNTNIFLKTFFFTFLRVINFNTIFLKIFELFSTKFLTQIVRTLIYFKTIF